MVMIPWFLEEATVFVAGIGSNRFGFLFATCTGWPGFVTVPMVLGYDLARTTTGRSFRHFHGTGSVVLVRLDNMRTSFEMAVSTLNGTNDASCQVYPGSGLASNNKRSRLL